MKTVKQALSNGAITFSLIIGTAGVFTSCQSKAEEAAKIISTQEYAMVFVRRSDVKEVDAAQALLGSAKGEKYLKCQAMELSLSKSGTSISLRNVKKPKAP